MQTPNRSPILLLLIPTALLVFSGCFEKEASAGITIENRTQSAPPVPAPPALKKLDAAERDAVVTAYETALADSVPVSVGSPEAEVLARLGAPDGVMTLGDRKRLTYAEGSLMIAGGTVTQIDGIPAARLSAPDPESYAAYQEAKGKIYYNGRWMTEAESETAYRETVEARREAEIRMAKARLEMARQAQANARYAREQALASAPYRDIRRGGAAIELDELLVPGKITVVDFYADWCGPCRKIAPQLKALADDPRVAVRKVDIVNWKSPVARQWRLRSIPNMRVFDRSGEQVGSATSSLQQVQNYIAQAR